MKQMIPVLLALLVLAGACIKMKHEMTIQPIHITVEVHVKIDKALDDFFADIDQANKDRAKQGSVSTEKKEEKK